MKKLCMVVFNYYDIDSRVKRQAEFIADMGWKVDIIALKSQFRAHNSTHKNIKVHELSLAKLRGSLLRYLFQYTFFCAFSLFLLAYLHLKNRYSVIQVHNLPDFLVFSAILPRIFRCPLLLDMHEITPEFFISKYGLKREHLVIQILTFIEKLCIKFSSHVITVNESIRELLISRGVPPVKISTILDSADEKLFIPEPAAPHDNNKFILMYHGTLTQLYGIDVAIRSLSHISAEERAGIKMKIAGEGPEEEELKKLVDELGLKESVEFLGNYPLEEIPAIIDKCDVGICPTKLNELTEYSLSTKLLEYVYMDKPIIASRLMTYQKYFDESCLAYFTPGNEKECSEQIRLLFTNGELRKTLAHNAKTRYQDISWNNIKDRYYDILIELSGEVKN